jgi:hypothetical protein
MWVLVALTTTAQQLLHSLLPLEQQRLRLPQHLALADLPRQALHHH